MPLISVDLVPCGFFLTNYELRTGNIVDFLYNRQNPKALARLLVDRGPYMHLATAMNFR